MFAWILRGCRDECSASDQLKQVVLSPQNLFLPLDFERTTMEKEGCPPRPLPFESLGVKDDLVYDVAKTNEDMRKL
jgi:hypothetical protein